MKDVLFSYDNEYDVCYSTPERALRELAQRRSNQRLSERVRREIYFTKALEECLKEPRLVFFRQIATPLNETVKFLDLSKKLGLKPLIFEYHKDKFVGSSNLYKRGLGKMPIFKFTAKSGEDVLEYKTIVDFNKFTGIPLSDVRTLCNESLLEAHHKFCNQFFGINISEITIDLSDWFTFYKAEASEYYTPLMTLFLRDAILCENFVTTPAEEDFFTRVARPAFKQVCEQYGLDPLVLRLIDKESEQRIFWDCYPTQIAELLSKNGYS